jgi:hypothetical protein
MVSKACRAFGRVFTRPTHNRDGRYGLRSTDKWRTQRFCNGYRDATRPTVWPPLPGFVTLRPDC